MGARAFMRDLAHGAPKQIILPAETLAVRLPLTAPDRPNLDGMQTTHLSRDRIDALVLKAQNADYLRRAIRSSSR